MPLTTREQQEDLTLNPAHQKILIAINNEPKTQTEIKNILETSQSSISRYLAELEEEGYVAQTGHKKGSRLYAVQPRRIAIECVELLREIAEDKQEFINKLSQIHEEEFANTYNEHLSPVNNLYHEQYVNNLVESRFFQQIIIDGLARTANTLVTLKTTTTELGAGTIEQYCFSIINYLATEYEAVFQWSGDRNLQDFGLICNRFMVSIGAHFVLHVVNEN